MNQTNSPVHNFTIEYSGIIRDIITDIGIFLPVGKEEFNKGTTNVYQTKALWDTGATGSVITKDTGAKLGLKPISMVQVTHAGGTSYQNQFLVNIRLPNNVIIPAVKVTECHDNVGNFGAIIGMDIITAGDFALTNINGKSRFTFRIPSLASIDFVKEANELNKKLLKNIGRNDACPCGSGKKFKNCCLGK